MKKIKKWLKKVYKILRLEEMQILPGQLAFFLVVSVFAMLPLIALIGSGFVTREFAESLKDLPYGFGAAIGYSMITDNIKTIDDAINEATIDMESDKENNK